MKPIVYYFSICIALLCIILTSCNFTDEPSGDLYELALVSGKVVHLDKSSPRDAKSNGFFLLIDPNTRVISDDQSETKPTLGFCIQHYGEELTFDNSHQAQFVDVEADKKTYSFKHESYLQTGVIEDKAFARLALTVNENTQLLGPNGSFSCFEMLQTVAKSDKAAIVFHANEGAHKRTISKIEKRAILNVLEAWETIKFER